MNCQDIQKFAFAYLDCEFDARERGEFEAHLGACCRCRIAVQRDQLFREVVRRNLDTPPADAQLRNRLRERIQCAHQRRLSRTVIVPLTLVAGGAIVAVAWWALPQAQMGGPQIAGAVPLVQPAAPARPIAPQPRVIVQQSPKPSAVALAPKPAQPNVFVPVQYHPDPDRFLPDPNRGEVLRGALSASALEERSPFGAVRSQESLRRMAQLHAAWLPPEVQGPATRVQRYLAARVPGIGPLPVAEGAGVELLGARLVVLGAQPVVMYSYRAYGVPVTVISRKAANPEGDDPEVEAVGPDSRQQAGILLDRRGDLSLLHVVSHDRVLTLVSELGGHALLQLAP